MGLTIKEKVMKAWYTDAVVRIQMQSGRCFEGLVGNVFSDIGGKPAVLLTSYNAEGEVTDHRHLAYEDIAKEDRANYELITEPEPAVEDPPADDIAKERWEAHQDGPNLLIRDSDGLHLARRINATDAQMQTMAAAPQMRDALGAVYDAWRSGEMDLNSADDEDSVNLFADVNDALDIG